MKVKLSGLTFMLVIGLPFLGLAAVSTIPTFVAPAETGALSENSESVQQDQNAQPLDYDAESSEYPLGRGTPGFALSLGGAFQHFTGGWDTAPTAVLRYYFRRRDTDTDGPEALSPWSVELGAVFYHKIYGGSSPNVIEHLGNYSYDAQVTNYGSEDVAVQYRWALRWPIRMNPELSLGLSMAQIKGDFGAIDAMHPYGFQETSNTTSLGPLARVGLPLLANDWFMLRVEVGYAHYANTINVDGQSINMRLSGFSVYPSIQVSLGYLQPGVEKGTYLPSTALPLWVIAAIQTGNRSPIIAPPEILLNPNQAAVQGGLSGNVMFQYKSHTAQTVQLMGDFNQWKPEPMYLDKAHVWVTVKDLKAGTYHYVFLINGHKEIRDPWNSSFNPSSRAHGVSVFMVPEVMPSAQ